MRSSVFERLATLALILVPVAFGLFALSRGQDANWDLRNYHWYNPYAFLHGRLSVDLGAAHIATFYNPLLDVPTFLAGRAMPARIVGFGLGLIHGLNFIVLFALAARLLAEMAPFWSFLGRRATAAVVALVGVLGGGHLSLVGTTFNDNLVSLAIFAAMLIVLRHAAGLFGDTEIWPRAKDTIALLVAGALAGAVVGLKLPTSPFAVGLCVAFLCVGGTFLARFTRAFLFGLGVLAGFAVSGAPWMFMLWRDYGNPLFPYFNDIFHSSMGTADSYRDVRFVPNTVASIVSFPLIFSVNARTVGEVVFRDYRLVMAYVLILATFVVGAFRILRPQVLPLSLTPSLRYLIAVTAVTYVLWMAIFAIYRYLVPLEMLAPLLIVGILEAWPGSARARGWAIGCVLVGLTVTAQPGDWEHTAWQSGPFVGANVPTVAAPSQSLGLITGSNPVAWVIPFFPPQIPFLRVQGYLNGPGQEKNGLNDRVRATIAAHTGPLFVLFPLWEPDAMAASLAAYELAPDLQDCQSITSNLGDYVRWCRVYRTNQSARPN